MIKAVLFDLDGTLVNSLEDLANSTNYALQKYGFPTHEVEEFKYFVGNGIPKLIERALPENKLDAEMEKKCLDVFMEHYRLHYVDCTYVYDGIKDLVSDLKDLGVTVAVISNKAQEMAEKVVFKLLGNVFDMVVGKRENYPAKPDPTLTLEIMKELNVKPDECIFIGDSGMDVAVGVNSGALPVGVLWGFRTKDELINNGAVHIIEKPNELVKIIKDINNAD